MRGACPGCGAYWGHPDPTLDFPNRVKVDNHWKCYNPECEVGFYLGKRVIELKPTPEVQAALDRFSVAHQAWLAKGSWRQEGNTFTFIPAPGSGPAPTLADYR